VTLPWLRRITLTKIENLKLMGHIVFDSSGRGCTGTVAGNGSTGTGDRFEFEGIGMLRIIQNRATTEILQSENKSMSV
jgi:hypothetical protein